MESGPLKILLVEDNQGDARLFREALAEPGDSGRFCLAHVGKFADALSYLARNEADVVFLDLSLPDAHGIQTVTKARLAAPHVPIIVLTGLNDEHFAIQAVREGAQDYLVKGQIDRHLIVRAMRYAIERHRFLREREKAETEIQKLATFVRLNPNPVLEFGGDGALGYFNDAAHTMALTLGKQHPAEILPSETMSIVKDCLSTGRSRLQLETSLNKRTISWSFFPIRSCQVVHCYAADITERQNLEAQLRQAQKMESVGKMAGGIAHDFNNILTIIHGHASLLLEASNLPQDLAKSVQRISSAAERAANLTRQLLMFSRKQLMQPKNLDLRKVVSSMVKMLQPILGEDISLELCHSSVLPLVYADPGMMEQVIMNLAVNSRDAMPHGGRLIIQTSVVASESLDFPQGIEEFQGPVVCLSVTDTGCGIPQEHLPHIFEPFFTTKDVSKGTGLGLATVYGIVRQHQGWIRISSELGKGTTFLVFLPGVEDRMDVGDAVPIKVSVRGGQEVILIVEDELPLRELIRNILEGYGYKVLEASSGLSALEIWKEYQSNIDLLLTDIVMPGGLTGRELAAQLRAEKPQLRVIFSSGYSEEVVGKGYVVEEGYRFLQKPYHPEKIAQTIRDCLDA